MLAAAEQASHMRVGKGACFSPLSDTILSKLVMLQLN